jgi:hypothetical protein
VHLVGFIIGIKKKKRVYNAIHSIDSLKFSGVYQPDPSQIITWFSPISMSYDRYF